MDVSTWRCHLFAQLFKHDRLAVHAISTHTQVQAVSAFGLEFEFLSTVFPGRSRSELRNKWRRESKKDPEKADEVFMAPKTTSIQDEVLETLKQVCNPSILLQQCQLLQMHVSSTPITVEFPLVLPIH